MTARLIALDLLAAVVATATWLGAGAAAAARRPRPALALLVAAVLASLARAGTVLALASAGWWFVQEKVTLTGPLLGVAGLAAVVLGGPPLVAAARRGGQADSVGRPGIVVPLLSAGYAAAAGLFFTLLLGYPST